MKFIAATDGSNLLGDKFGWSWVMMDTTGKVVGTCYGSNLIDDSWAHGWNVAAECTAVIHLLSKVNKDVEIEIFHDYEGLGKWARNEWKAKSPVSIGYKSHLLKLDRNVTFTWVKSHNGHEMNELVDTLAYKALQEQPEEPILIKG